MKLIAWIHCVLLVHVGISSAALGNELAHDWPWWRGPNSNGVAAAGQTPPVEFGETKNVVWKVDVPGRGHSSPIVVGQRVLLTTADEDRQVQSVLCFDRKTGRQEWKTDVNEGGFADKIHNKNTHASPSLACDGERLFAVFSNNDSAQLVVLDLDGKQLWTKKAATFSPGRYEYGYAPSPLLYKQLVIVASEYDGEGSTLAAFERQTGREVWRTPRPSMTSYSSPIIAHVADRDQLLISGCGRTTSYDPATGKQLWQCEGPAKATCGTMVWDGDLVFASGGYPEKETMAIRADGSAEVVWRSAEKCYEQSMVAHDDTLYAVNDTGIALCWDAQTGKPHWKVRLSGPVSASPTLAGGNIYAADEKGNFYVFRADPAKFTLLAKNQLGDESFASPTIAGNQIFLRVANGSGSKRQETLYCFGNDEGR